MYYRNRRNGLVLTAMDVKFHTKQNKQTIRDKMTEIIFSKDYELLAQ